MRDNQAVDDARVKIFAKIKSPTLEELHTAPSRAQFENTSARFLSPNGSKASTQISYHLDDFPLSFYAFDDSNSKKVFYFPNPLSKRALGEKLYSEKNADNQHAPIFSSSKAYEFDRAFSVNNNNQTVFLEESKDLVYELFQGQNSTVFLYGASKSGKNHLLKGVEGREKGLATYLLDELFKTIDLSLQSQDTQKGYYQVFCSISCVYQDAAWDLNQKQSSRYDQNFNEDEADSQQPSPSYEQISNTEDFRNLFRRAVIRLKTIASNYKNPSLNLESSLLITFGLIKFVDNGHQSQIVEQESYLSLVKLPDVDSAQKSPDLKLLFQNLNDYIVFLGRKSRYFQPGSLSFICFTSGERYSSPEKLQKHVLLDNVPALQTDDLLVHFLCCLPPSEQHSKFALESLRYAADLFTTIKQGSNAKTFASNRDLDTGRTQQHQELDTDREEPLTHRVHSNQPIEEGEDQSEHFQEQKGDFLETAGDDYEEDDNEQERNIKMLERSIDELKEEMFRKLHGAFDKTPQTQPKDSLKSYRQHEEVLKTNRSIDTLQKILQKKEKFELESNQALKGKIQRLKARNKKFQDELVYMSEVLRERDEIIAQYEAEISWSQRELTASNRKIISQKMKKENVKKLRHDVSEVIAGLKRKLQTKTVKYKEALERLTYEHNETVEGFSLLHKEHQNLQQLYAREREVADKEDEKIRSEIEKLKDELMKKSQLLHENKIGAELKEEMITDLKYKLHEEKTDKKILSDENASLALKLEGMKKQLIKIEADNENLLRRLESERDTLSSSKKSELLRSKEKQKKTKQDLKKAEQIIRQLEQELIIVKRDNDRLRSSEEDLHETRGQMAKLLKDIELLQEKNDQLARRHLEDRQKESESILNLQNEIERLSEENIHLSKELMNYQSEKERLIGESKQRTALLDKYENQLEYLQKYQTQEIEDMNSKIKDFVHKITFLRAENERKNILADNLAQKLATAENERNEYMRHSLELKKENKALKKNINLIDAKMKQLIDINRATNESDEYEEIAAADLEEEETPPKDSSDEFDEEEGELQ